MFLYVARISIFQTQDEYWSIEKKKNIAGIGITNSRDGDWKKMILSKKWNDSLRQYS